MFWDGIVPYPFAEKYLKYVPTMGNAKTTEQMRIIFLWIVRSWLYSITKNGIVAYLSPSTVVVIVFINKN